MSTEHSTLDAASYFLAGSKVATPLGERPIQFLRNGNRVVSLNEEQGKRETSAINAPKKVTLDHYYSVNGVLRCSGNTILETPDGLKQVQDLEAGDKVLSRYETLDVTSVEKHEQEVAGYSLPNVNPNDNFYIDNFLAR